MTKWKIMPCPQHGGKHPFHDRRYIVTEDAATVFNGLGEWDLERGAIICVMRDGPPEHAQLIVAAPEMQDALADCIGVLDSINRQLGGESVAVRAVLDKAQAAFGASHHRP